jgi:hypothetical protein
MNKTARTVLWLFLSVILAIDADALPGLDASCVCCERSQSSRQHQRECSGDEHAGRLSTISLPDFFSQKKMPVRDDDAFRPLFAKKAQRHSFELHCYLPVSIPTHTSSPTAVLRI